MKHVLFIVFLTLILGACQAVPETIPTTTLTQTPMPSATATLLPTAPVTPTPTTLPTATTSPQTLEERAGALCEKAGSAPVESKSFRMPYLELRKTERDLVPAWRVGNSIPHLFALSEESVHSIICSLETRRQVGVYTDASAAFQLTLRIKVLTWPEGTVVFSKTVESGMPPKTKIGFGGGYGSYPAGSSINEWILGLFDHPDFLYFPDENIYSVAISPDGRQAALGISPPSSQSSTVQTSRIVLVDLQNLQTILEWDAHKGSPYDVAFSPDGKVIASVGNDSSVYFWNVQTGEILHRIDLPFVPHTIKYSPQGELIGVMTASDMYLIDSQSMQISASYSPIGTTFFFSPDGQVIYSDTGGFDARTGDTIFELSDPLDMLPTIAPDGTVTFDTPDAIMDFILSPDGTYAVSYSPAPYGDSEGTKPVFYLSVWDMQTRERLSRTRFAGQTFDILGFSPDGKQLAVNNGIEIWFLETDTWQVTRILAGHTNPIQELAFFPDGRKIISISSDRTVRVWSPAE